MQLYIKDGVHVDLNGNITPQVPLVSRNDRPDIKLVLKTIQSHYIMPFYVSQQVLALHP